MAEHRIFTHDTFPEVAPVAPRFTPGTRLRTPDGPREIETLAIGDAVETRDGPRRIARIASLHRTRGEWTYERTLWPVHVPVGSLGNARPMRLSADQDVLLSGEIVRRVCGVGEISVHLRDLVGLRGLIVARPLADLRYHGVAFACPAVVEAEDVPCAIETVAATAVAREMARVAFAELHAAGEPRLRN